MDHGDGPGDSLPLIGGSHSLASLPSNHNPFLGEPNGNNSGNGNFAGAGAGGGGASGVQHIVQGQDHLQHIIVGGDDLLLC